jgi:hypothetical protein
VIKKKHRRGVNSFGINAGEYIYSFFIDSATYVTDNFSCG